MAGGIQCSFPTDFQADTTFRLQVNSSTSSIYSDLYLTVPPTSPGVAELTTDVGPVFWLAGTQQQACNRQSPLCTVVGDNEYCLQINPNAAGLAQVVSIASVTTVSDGFYVDANVDPFSYWIPNAGSYYACTDGFGDISVYFRLNTTTTPRGCEDLVLNIELGR